MDGEMIREAVSLGCSAGILGSLTLYLGIRFIDLLFGLIRERHRVLRYSRYYSKAIDGFSGYAQISGISDLTVQYVRQACAYYERHRKKHHYLPERGLRP